MAADAVATVTNPEVITFTEKESRTLLAAWGAMKTPPEVDLKKLTSLAGFNTEKTASNTWGTIKKKLAKIISGEGIPASGPLAPSPASTPSRKRNAVDDMSTDNGSTTPTSIKQKRSRMIPAKKEIKDEVKSEEDD